MSQEEPERDVETIVRDAARKHGLNEDHFVAIAKCESSLGINLINRGYTASDGSNPTGVFQFIQSTYLDFAPRAGFPKQDDRLDTYSNVNVAAWAFANGRASHWECR